MACEVAGAEYGKICSLTSDSGCQVTLTAAMGDTKPHPKVLEEIEREGIADLVEVLREEGIEGVRYVLWDATGWHRDYSPPAWRNRATDEQKRIGWEMAVRIEKIIATVLHEAHKRQGEEAMETFQRDRKVSTGAT